MRMARPQGAVSDENNLNLKWVPLVREPGCSDGFGMGNRGGFGYCGNCGKKLARQTIGAWGYRSLGL